MIRRRTARGVGFALCVVAAAGCARWHRAGASEEAFLVDRLECREEARISSRDRRGMLVETWQIDQDRFAGCMTRRGYTRGRPAARPAGEGATVASPLASHE